MTRSRSVTSPGTLRGTSTVRCRPCRATPSQASDHRSRPRIALTHSLAPGTHGASTVRAGAAARELQATLSLICMKDSQHYGSMHAFAVSGLER